MFLATLVAIAISVPAFASKTNKEETEMNTIENPQVCQYSLSRYSGTITSNGVTEQFTVGLSCPIEKDTYATVVVFIDGEHAASDVVKVPAGKTRSALVSISVGGSFAGKPYRLMVQ